MIDEKKLAKCLTRWIPPHLEVHTSPPDMSVDGEIWFSDRETGARHSVSVQVGSGYAAVGTTVYETKDLGDGVSVRMVDGQSDLGYRNPSHVAAIGADLARAFAECRDPYEAVRGPNVATHPHFESVLATVREAVSGREGISIRINAEPSWAGPDEDLIQLVDADGNALPLAVSTIPGGAATRDASTGDEARFRHFEFASIADRVAASLDAGLPPAP